MSTSIKITNYRAYDRGKALKGFFTVTLESGLIIHTVVDQRPIGTTPTGQLCQLS